MPPQRVSHPNAVLLIDAEVEWPEEGFTGFDISPLANDLSLA